MRMTCSWERLQTYWKTRLKWKWSWEILRHGQIGYSEIFIWKSDETLEHAEQGSGRVTMPVGLQDTCRCGTEGQG